jgi:hypothetical protein
MPAHAKPTSIRQKLTYVLIALLVALGGTAWWWFHRPAPAYVVQDPGVYPFQGLSADGKTQKWGFIDADGKVLIPPQWDAVDFSYVLGQSVYCNEGFCGVLKDGKWGFIDINGQLVIPTQFNAIGSFVEGLARVYLGNQVGFIDKKGQYAINPQFSGAGDFHDGLAAVHGDDGWGFINKTGTYVIKPSFQGIDVDGFSGGLAGACRESKCGYIDRSGIFAIRPQFNSVNTFSDGLAGVLLNGKWGYVNQAGKIVINPQFDMATKFSDGLAAVSVSGKQGTINKQGKYVVNPGLYNIQIQSGDLQPVTSVDGVGLITRDGKLVVKPAKAITGIGQIVGKIYYANFNNGLTSPVSLSTGKLLAGPYKGASVYTLAQDIANESSALQSMNLLAASEMNYTNTYTARGFTSSLSALGPAQGVADERHAGYIDADLASGTKDGYQFAISIPEGSSTGGANISYFILAKPAAGHAGRTFCADASGTIHYAVQGGECTTTSPTL